VVLRLVDGGWIVDQYPKPVSSAGDPQPELMPDSAPATT
jgi:hypothetical protein